MAIIGIDAMRVNIGQISVREADELITLQCNIQSLFTLRKINDGVVDPAEIELKITQYKRLYDKRWIDIYNKYNIPNYLGEVVKIDYETGMLYYNKE